MIGNIIQYLENLVLHFGPTGVFIASFIEEFFAPVPSGIVILSAGYGLMEGLPITVGNIFYLYFTVAIPISLGLTLGSLLWYGLAFHYGEPLLRRFGRYIGLSWKDVEKYQSKLEKSHKDEWLLFGLRCFPFIPSIVVNVVAGLMRVRIMPYVLITFIGVSIRATILGIAGWQLGKVYREYAHVIDKFEKIILVVIVLSFVGFVTYKKRQKRK